MPFAVWASDVPTNDNRPAERMADGKYFKPDRVTMHLFMLHFLLSQFKGILRSATWRRPK